jgi:hypothetical protein
MSFTLPVQAYYQPTPAMEQNLYPQSTYNQLNPKGKKFSGRGHTQIPLQTKQNV